MSIAVAVPASTVVLLRGDHPFEVFLVRRSDSVAFLGGAHVFPGGRVDPADRIHDVVGGVRLQADSFVAATENLTSRMPDVPADVVIAHHVAAVRELFEEAGVLLARPLTAASVQRLTADRRELLAGRITFGDIVRREHLHLALDELAYFAHWVTPPVDTRQFDTRFFMTRVPPHQTPAHDDTETTHSLWARPVDAIAQSIKGEIVLPPPTWTTLRELEPFESVKDALAWARRRTVVRRMPKAIEQDGHRMLLLPGDPLHPEPAGDEPPLETRFVLVDRRWRAERPPT